MTYTLDGRQYILKGLWIGVAKGLAGADFLPMVVARLKRVSQGADGKLLVVPSNGDGYAHLGIWLRVGEDALILLCGV
jgi:hypothetical protein